MLEILCWVLYANVYISVGNNRKRTVNLRKEEAPSTAIEKSVDAFLGKKVTKETAFSAKLWL